METFSKLFNSFLWPLVLIELGAYVVLILLSMVVGIVLNLSHPELLADPNNVNLHLMIAGISLLLIVAKFFISLSYFRKLFTKKGPGLELKSSTDFKGQTRSLYLKIFILAQGGSILALQAFMFATNMEVKRTYGELLFLVFMYISLYLFTVKNSKAVSVVTR